MKVYDLIKIECIKKNIKISDLSSQFGYSRQALHKNILRIHKPTLIKLEKILELPKGTLIQE